ncbi:ABC transporter permease [Streptomyces sp. TRM68367]|uniref:ABC transporter permease n=1 Tax=Streptomyces sp. TRM68367 TaxID=2758415 RepID=UPI00165B2C5F|nr:ABC transporter permease [Streptomyces sp. TRM68367]MBC9727073.1 ABC transporter permease [Streptomyces sp. TRM68367]
MTTAHRTELPENAGRPGLEVSRPGRPSVGRVFLAILWRDAFVTGKEFGLLLVQIALTPLFMLFIFAKVLGTLNYVRPEFGDLLLPGIAALAAFLTALQSVAYPLVMEFGVTREMEDRLLAPLPVHLVAVEKLLMATLRGLVASACIFPLGALVLGDAPWRAAGMPLLLLVLALGSWAGAAIGITVGTLVPPHRISIMFALIMAPLMFTGATQYPLVSLDDLRWFQVVSALNPLTYTSEGVRAALVPSIPHVQPWLCVLALTGYALAFTAAGIAAFRHRAQK